MEVKRQGLWENILRTLSHLKASDLRKREEDWFDFFFLSGYISKCEKQKFSRRV